MIDRANRRILAFEGEKEGYHFKGIIPVEEGRALQDIKVFDGKIYVLDSLTRRISVFAGKSVAGRYDLSSLPFPMSFALDGEGRLYVLDGHLAKVVVLNEEGKVVTEMGRLGWKEGEFYHPRYLLLNKRGMLFVVDTGNDRVQIFRLR